jgi:uncharacterized protein (UPF0332 family)
MNQAFRECLKNRKIISFPRGKGLIKKEMAAAEEDLIEAKDRFQNSRFKYATINAYYSIFHAARALLYSRGYRERSHHCLSIALEALFVESGLMDNRFIRIFRNNMVLRESADYGDSFSMESASLSVLNAEEFVKMAIILLRKQ